MSSKVVSAHEPGGLENRNRAPHLIVVGASVGVTDNLVDKGVKTIEIRTIQFIPARGAVVPVPGMFLVVRKCAVTFLTYDLMFISASRTPTAKPFKISLGQIGRAHV